VRATIPSNYRLRSFAEGEPNGRQARYERLVPLDAFETFSSDERAHCRKG